MVCVRVFVCACVYLSCTVITRYTHTHTQIYKPLISLPLLHLPIHPSTPPLSQTEVETGYLQSQADEYGYVLAACDWWGMAEYDEPAVAYMIAMDIGDFGMIPERLTQGMLNALLLMRLLKVSFHNNFWITYPTFKLVLCF